MGINHEAPSAPDTFGLVEYFISDVATEIDGPNVRVVCGIRKFGTVHWLYTVVVNATDYLRINEQVKAAAEEAYNLTQMMDRRAAH